MVKLWSVSNTVAPSDGIKRTPTDGSLAGSWRGNQVSGGNGCDRHMENRVNNFLHN